MGRCTRCTRNLYTEISRPLRPEPPCREVAEAPLSREIQWLDSLGTLLQMPEEMATTAPPVAFESTDDVIDSLLALVDEELSEIDAQRRFVSPAQSLNCPDLPWVKEQPVFTWPSCPSAHIKPVSARVLCAGAAPEQACAAVSFFFITHRCRSVPTGTRRVRLTG